MAPKKKTDVEKAPAAPASPPQQPEGDRVVHVDRGETLDDLAAQPAEPQPAAEPEPAAPARKRK